ncbi:MAG: glycosidase, -protein [Acidimicrobiales bacterium]|nr:glycosidase, -protein [Acidimicrobiales bacterium]
MTPAVRRSSQRLRADPSRVITQLFVPGHEGFDHQESRASPVLERLLALDDDEVRRSFDDVVERFDGRHRHLEETFGRHADELADRLDHHELSPTRRLLLGATFTNEYAIEGAALCNPSVVADPDQSGVPAGSLRVVMSVRAIGEGHRSSIGFRAGMIDAAGEITIDVALPFATTGQIAAVPFEAAVFRGEFHRLHGGGEDVDFVLGERTYGVRFPADTSLSERVLWPAMGAECQGMEDARFVHFVEDDGAVSYYATYTAYDGVDISQQLLETTDFITFTSSPIVGPAAANKGLALFPRRIGGRFAALSRSDRETNTVTFSDNPRRWERSIPCQVPTRPWELLQLGNCGSPIETDAGWLVLTHGVGPMRTYSIGAILLELDDPTRIIGQLAEPLLSPSPDEQDGYVPNVVYSCGALVHAGTLVVPYGIGDAAIGMATVPLPDLLSALGC